MDSVYKKYNVFLAHCLTNNGGAGNIFSVGKNIYQRIDWVINSKPEISCSTIKENDTLKYLKISNFFGPVGIILKNSIITYTNSEDGGTSVLQTGQRDYIIDEFTTPNEVNIMNSIIKRHPNRYNELCAKSYDIFGLFLCFDDLDYLIQNIISEELFYQNTEKYRLTYFILSHGILHRALFNQSVKKYYGSGICRPDEIYQDRHEKT